MPLYDKPLTRIIEEEALPQLPEPFSSRDLIDWLGARYPKFKHSTIRSHLRSMAANDPNKKYYNSPRQDLLFKVGRSLYRRYDAERDGFYDKEGKLLGELADDVDPGEPLDEPTEGDVEFALEVHLEEFMEANWDKIDFGAPLRLYQRPSGEHGRQFATPIGPIDFLCENTATGDLVVVELKKGRTSDRVLGQCQRYMGWIRSHLAKPEQTISGLIIAAEQDEGLRYALLEAPHVEMRCFKVDFQLYKPDSGGDAGD